MEPWTPDTGIDISSAFKSITTPLKDLYDEVHKRGWTVKSLKWSKDQFEATAQNPHGETVKTGGNTEQTALGNLVVKIMRSEHARITSARHKLGMWEEGWEDQLEEIAKEYAEAPVYDPKAASSWMALAHDSVRRARVIHIQLQVEVTDDPVPYKSVVDMMEDVTKKKHIALSRANADHPVWSVDQVLAFRLVHDVLGHVVSGGDWGWHGENLATQAHMPLLAPDAQQALFTETIGQAAYHGAYRAFGSLKIVHLKVFEDFQIKLNPAGHGGIHPSQSIVPAELPEIEPIGPEPKKSRRLADAPSYRDPNYDWQSGIDPLPDNAYMWHRDPQTGTDPLDTHGSQEALKSLDTGWHSLTHPNGTEDRTSAEHAVVNALRATLMRSRQAEKWATIHYQHLMSLPPNVSDPRRFQDALGKQRDYWNKSRGQADQSHAAPYHAELQKLKQFVKALNPGLDDREIHEKVGNEFHHMWNEEEERILNDDADHLLHTRDIDKLVGQNMRKRLRIVTKPNTDQKYDFGEKALYHEASMDDAELYHPWLGNHINTVAQVGRHAEELTDAALTDMRQHGGKGHHWRKNALSLGISGLGPAEASHAWNLLTPGTSQLASIDPHILEVLGHKPDDANDRDYFKYERELAAARDAMGYGHVPLGAFTQNLWNYKNYGPGVHPDQSHFRALNPAHWTNLVPPTQSQGWANPPWWEATEPARDMTAQQFDRSLGTNFPKDVYPFQTVLPQPHVAALEGPTPWFVHQDGSMIEGTPGQALMQHLRKSLGLSTEEVWGLDPEAGKA